MLLDILLVLHLQVLVIASSSSAEEDESRERDAQHSKGEQICKIRASISVTVCKTADLRASCLFSSLYSNVKEVLKHAWHHLLYLNNENVSQIFIDRFNTDKIIQMKTFLVKKQTKKPCKL